MHQNHNFITINIVAALHFWTILVPIFYGVIDITKNASSFLEKFVIFMAVTDSHFLWHIFSSTVKWLFIMNFVSNCQFFSLERCNKAHWDPGKLIVNEQTFSIKLQKSWIPDWNDTLLMGPNHNVRTVVGLARLTIIKHPSHIRIIKFTIRRSAWRRVRRR